MFIYDFSYPSIFHKIGVHDDSRNLILPYHLPEIFNGVW